MRFLVAILLNTVVMFCCMEMAAAEYPDKPIRLVVPFAPSGNNDITAREVAGGLTKFLGQTVIVDNRGGAGGRLGTDLVAKAPADGYTMLIGSSSVLTIAPAFFRVGYDPLRDFSYTSLISTLPVVLVAHPSMPTDVKELIAKARSVSMRMGSAGVGSLTHLAGERFQLATSVKFTHVPYRGGGAAMVDVMGGQLDLMFELISATVGYVNSGRVRALAVLSSSRSQIMPSVPTMVEQGIPNVEAAAYNGIVLPAQSPKGIVHKVYDALLKVLDQPSTRSNFARLGSEAITSTPEQYAARVKKDLTQWTTLRKQSKLELE